MIGTSNKLEQRMTRRPVTITRSRKRIKQLDALIASWDVDTREFILARLENYAEKKYLLKKPKWRDWLIPKIKFKFLKNLGLLDTSANRYKHVGVTEAQPAYNIVFERECHYYDIVYLIDKLKKELDDIYIPPEFSELVQKTFDVHITNELQKDDSVPSSPIILITGPSGSGKTATADAAVERFIFSDEVLIRTDYDEMRERILKLYPRVYNWWGIGAVARLFKPIPAYKVFNREEELVKDYYRYKWLIGKKILSKRYIKLLEVTENKLKSLREEKRGIEDLKNVEDTITNLGLEKYNSQHMVNYAVLGPGDVHTAYSGMQGKEFNAQVGPIEKMAVLLFTEAHGIFEKPEKNSQHSSHDRTLLTAGLQFLDEIRKHKRPCLMIADTNAQKDLT